MIKGDCESSCKLALFGGSIVLDVWPAASFTVNRRNCPSHRASDDGHSHTVRPETVMCSLICLPISSSSKLLLKSNRDAANLLTTSIACPPTKVTGHNAVRGPSAVWPFSKEYPCTVAGTVCVFSTVMKIAKSIGEICMVWESPPYTTAISLIRFCLVAVVTNLPPEVVT